MVVRAIGAIDSMTLLEALPELVRDIEGSLVRLGRGAVADQLRVAKLEAWDYDDFAQSTYLDLVATRDPSAVNEVISLYDDIGVNLDLDRDGRILGIEVMGYEESFSRLGKSVGR